MLRTRRAQNQPTHRPKSIFNALWKFQVKIERAIKDFMKKSVAKNCSKLAKLIKIYKHQTLFWKMVAGPILLLFVIRCAAINNQFRNDKFIQCALFQIVWIWLCSVDFNIVLYVFFVIMSYIQCNCVCVWITCLWLWGEIKSK